MGTNVYKIQSRAKSKLCDIYSQAKCLHLTNEEIIVKILELKRALPKATPYYVQTYLNGCIEILTDQLYRDSLEFCFIMNNGDIVSTYKKSLRYYKTLGYSISELTDKKNRFYYIGTDKPY